MSAQYLIDTVIIVDHLNGIAEATAWLQSIPEGQAVVSVVTRAEVLVGTDKTDCASVTVLLDRYECLSIVRETADRASRLRRQHGWKLPDAFQAALAEQHGLRLATRNTKDFSEQKHSFVSIPYTL